MNQSIVVYDPVVAEVQHDRLTDQVLGWVNSNNADKQHRMELHQMKANLVKKSKSISQKNCKKKNAAYQRKFLKTAFMFVTSNALVTGMQADLLAVQWALPVAMLMLLYGVWLAGGLFFEWRGQCKRGR